MRLTLFLILPASILGALSFLFFIQSANKPPMEISKVKAVDDRVQDHVLLSPVIPRVSPTPTATISIPLSPEPSLIPSQTPGVTSAVLTAVNSYRKSFNLSPLITDPITCNFAKIRAQEIATSFTHDGFTNRVQTNTLPYPTYQDIGENIAMNSDPNQIISIWASSSNHAANMKKDVVYGCVQNNGNYYVLENWKP